jgi:hypothetical protein
MLSYGQLCSLSNRRATPIPALENQVDAAANSVEASARTSTLAKENFILSCLRWIEVGKKEFGKETKCLEDEENWELSFYISPWKLPGKLRQNTSLQPAKVTKVVTGASIHRSCQWFKRSPMRSMNPRVSDVILLHYTIIDEASEDESTATQSASQA